MSRGPKLAAIHLAKYKRKMKKRFLFSSDWTLWKAAYVPLSRIKPNVFQFTEFEQETEPPLRVRLVREWKPYKTKHVENNAYSL